MKRLLIGILLLLGTACSGDFRDDFGNRCWEDRAQWICTDGCACYKDCVLAATHSDQPYWNTKMCVRDACGYKRRCVE